MSWFRKKDPSEDPTALLNLLVKQIGWITEEQARLAIETRKVEELIGQRLIAMGIMTQEKLDDALFQQKYSRGQVSQREAVVRAMDQHASNQNIVASSLNELKDAAEAALAVHPHTHKV